MLFQLAKHIKVGLVDIAVAKTQRNSAFIQILIKHPTENITLEIGVFKVGMRQTCRKLCAGDSGDRNEGIKIL